MNDKKAREFYLDMGGDYANNIVELGNEYDLVSARMQLKSMAKKGSSGSRKSSKSDSSQGAGLNPIKHFAQASWKNKIVRNLVRASTPLLKDGACPKGLALRRKPST